MRIYNLTDNDDAAIVAQQGIFQVMEWKRDFSVTYGSAMDAYYASEMNVRRRQLVCNLNGKTGAVVQAGAMQWTVGHVEVTTGVKGVGDFIGKLARGAVTNESAVKPEYVGNGVVVLEPTYRHVLLLDPSQMGGAITVNDGLFYACETTIQQHAVMVSRPSAMVAGRCHMVARVQLLVQQAQGAGEAVDGGRRRGPVQPVADGPGNGCVGVAGARFRNRDRRFGERRAEGGRQFRDRVDERPAVHGRAFHEDADRFGCERRGLGQRVSRYGSCASRAGRRQSG